MRPKKHLGQHFLTAPSYAIKIAQSVPAESEEHVVEIGPGRGALSIHLKERYPSLHLVEVDKGVLEVLSGKLGDGQHTIHHHDVMTFDFSTIGYPLHVAGNLPYSIGAHIIKKVLLLGNNILSCTFMVQREVAERIVSSPHSKARGFLSVFCSFFGKPKLLFHVPPGAFFPRPNVDSSVFQIIPEPDLEKKLPKDQWEDFFALVSRAFTQRRKTVVNALSRNTGEKGELIERLKMIGIPEMARAENLSVAQWLELYRHS